MIVAEYSKGLADKLELVAYVVKVSNYPGKYIKLCFILWDMICMEEVWFCLLLMVGLFGMFICLWFCLVKLVWEP